MRDSNKCKKCICYLCEDNDKCFNCFLCIDNNRYEDDDKYCEEYKEIGDKWTSPKDIMDYVISQWKSRTKIDFEVESRIEDIVKNSLDSDTLLDKYKQYKKESFIAKGFTEHNLKRLYEYKLY